ncbi:MAG: rhomboid family intramembrane serine protease, partial [Candidatus Melainabacteria bacterium]|nr:rhomboid family intramembrane serine protease [Candidatus Melainabacteria bacterium]
GGAIGACVRYRYMPADERPWQCSFTLKTLLVFLALQVGTEFLIPNVAHSAHAGGMLVGLAIGFVLPLCQQPRLVASRDGIFSAVAEFKDSRLGKMASRIALTPTADFDRASDFLAVEYDRVDWRNRRTVEYVALLGTMPAAIQEDKLIFVASSRQIGGDSAMQFARRLAQATGQKEPEDTTTSKKVSSYSFTAAIIVYLLIADVASISRLLPYIAVMAAMAVIWMWYLIVKDTIGEVRRPDRLIAFVVGLAVVVGGGLAIAWLSGQSEVAVRLLVSVAAGHAIQRYIIMPLQLRAQKS